MAQITDGTVAVTPGSANIISTLNNMLDDWSTIVPGNMFTINGSGVAYFVANTVAPNASSSGFWEINLTAPYAGSGAFTNAAYTIITDFTAILGLPLLKRGDAESALIFSRAMQMLDVLFDSARNIRFLPDVTGYTGGGSTKLDGVDSSRLPTTNSLLVFIHATDGLKIYKSYLGGTGVAEASPGVILPDDNATTGMVFQSVF